MRLMNLYLQQQREKQRADGKPALRPATLPAMIDQFDALLESGDDDAADKAFRICAETQKRNGTPCGK